MACFAIARPSSLILRLFVSLPSLNSCIAFPTSSSALGRTLPCQVALLLMSWYMVTALTPVHETSGIRSDHRMR